MFDPRQLTTLLAFGARVDDLTKRSNDLVRDLGALGTEATGMDLLLTGPAEDAHGRLWDAQGHVAEAVGVLRALQLGLAGLLNAQSLPERVTALGWTFDGWGDGWQAWRTWEPGGARETVTDRTADGLLYKLEMRNAEEARHG